MANAVEKNFLDQAGLGTLVEQIKAEDVKAINAAKTYADSLADNYDAAGTAATKVEELANGQVKTNTDAIAVLNGDGEGSVTKAVADAKALVDANVDALEAKVGAVPEGSTVMGIITNIQENAYDDTEITEAIDAVDVKVTTLIGGDANKSVRTIANEELAAQLIPENASESLDTLQEIAAWIQSHPEDASAMNTAITKLEAIVDGIGDTGAGEKATVVAYVTDAIAALSIGDYAKAADLTALAGRVTTLEGASHTHENKAELDKIADGDKAKWDAATEKAHVHDNVTVLDGISAEKVTAWDAAEQNAKDYADGLNKTVNTEMTAVKGRLDTLESVTYTPITKSEIDALFATE